MKSLLFLSLAAFAVSNGNDGSFYQNPGTYFLFSGIGFAIGAVLGFFFARMPNFDYEEVKVSLKTLLPCMLIWGIIIAGIGAIATAFKNPVLPNKSGFLFYINKMLTKYISSGIKVILYVFLKRFRLCRKIKMSKFTMKAG